MAWSSGRNRDKLSLNFADALTREECDVTHFDGAAEYNHLTINSKMGSETNSGVTGAVTDFLAKHV